MQPQIGKFYIAEIRFRTNFPPSDYPRNGSKVRVHCHNKQVDIVTDDWLFAIIETKQNIYGNDLLLLSEIEESDI